MAPAPGATRAWSVVAVLLVLAVLASVDRNAIALMVDPIRASLGINDFQMGLLQGPAFAVFFLIGSLPMGWIVDRYSQQWAIYLGVSGWSLATIACGLAGSFYELLIARCLVGLGEAVLQPAGWSIVARLFPPHRLGLVIGVLSAGAQIGAAASYMLGAFLIAGASRFAAMPLPLVGQLAPWQLVFLAAGVPGLLLAALIFIAPSHRPLRPGPARQAGGGLMAFIRGNRGFLTYHFLGFSLHSAAVFGAAAWMPTYLLRNHELDVRTVGGILALLAVPVGAGGVLFAGWLVDRSFGRGRDDAHLTHFACVAALIAVIGGLGFNFAASLPAIVLTFGLIQFLQPFSGVSGAVLQISTPVEFRGRISAAYIMFYNAVGMTLGPSFVVFLGDYVIGPGKLGTALALTYALFGSAAAILLWLGRKHAARAVQRHGRIQPS
ncbi:major Facilitator Superfamily protein [Janthinobacterium agaricidamnosum NBRC 102515 = DSM 9628]|uniref:Major Facilitator Superfamily protein n=2 Tax=Janthinobacterium agaricidamnosum TaxID=55508 RepID=W0V689_9BURK|nr:major Facilitator Superfamily protein [Janthinobacterium agaricidamnosum NBRC 102515 = DSM 9628]